MSKNQMTFVAVALALAVFAAIALRQESATVTNQQAGARIFPGLMNKVNDVAQILVQKGEQSITIKRDNNQWQVTNKDGYPANITKVKQTILGIADFETVEAKTKKAENYKQLEVDDSSSLVTLQDAQGQTLAALILGKVIDNGFSAATKAKMYVRKNGDDQVWLVKGELHADPVVTDWLAEDIMNIDPARIQQVSIQQADKKSYSIKKQKAEDKHFTLGEIPKGKQMKSESAADDIAKALQSLRLSDVQKAGKVEFATDKTTHTEYQSFDGLIVTADIVSQDKDSYVKFTARFDASLRADAGPAGTAEGKNSTDSKTEAASENKPANPHAVTPAPLTDAATVQQQVAEMNERLSPWVFKLPQHKVDLMKKPMADLLKDVK